MMLHHTVIANMYTRFGARGMDLLDVLNAPRYAFAGVEHSTNANVARKFDGGQSAARLKLSSASPPRHTGSDAAAVARRARGVRYLVQGRALISL